MEMSQQYLIVNMAHQDTVEDIMLLGLSVLIVSFCFMQNCLFTFMLGNINPVNCTDGSIRLYGGSSAVDGILHVCANGAWGTVCSHSWDNAENIVACRQLGFLSYSEPDRTIYSMHTFYFILYL